MKKRIIGCLAALGLLAGVGTGCNGGGPTPRFIGGEPVVSYVEGRINSDLKTDAAYITQGQKSISNKLVLPVYKINVKLSQKGGVFETRAVEESSNLVANLTVEDVNKDGLKDLVYSEFDGASIKIDFPPGPIPFFEYRDVVTPKVKLGLGDGRFAEPEDLEDVLKRVAKREYSQP